MSEELQNAIQQLITKTLDGVDTSVAFLNAELPDYVYQLLLWYGVYNFLITVIFTIILCVAWYLPYKSRGAMLAMGMNWKNGPGWQVTWIFSVFISVPCVIEMNLIWLQIWIAPKVWLIEYASSLVK